MNSRNTPLTSIIDPADETSRGDSAVLKDLRSIHISSQAAFEISEIIFKGVSGDVHIRRENGL
jgi:hypothetical protein